MGLYCFTRLKLIENCRFTGLYTFTANADDGMVLYVNQQSIFYDYGDGSGGVRTPSGQINLVCTGGQEMSKS